MTRTVFALALVALAAAPARAAATSAADARHLLDRAAFGPRPGEVSRVQALGAKAWLQAQLHPAGVAESPRLEARLAALETLRMTPAALRETYMKPVRAAKGDPAARAEARKASRDPLEEAIAARLWRAAGSERQLQEVMVDFWADHFSVFSGKGPVRVWVGVYEDRALRAHALGRFRDLLGAVATHPAMLVYLDNARNNAAKGLNENYARELLELHTLGVDGGYTQADVVALARILTGWGLDRQGFAFQPKRHDGGEKVLLGQAFRPAGRAEVEAALDLLARHPSTARHLATKLARRFIADDPPKALVDRLAARFRETDGRIDLVLATLFDDPAFWAARGAKLKTPYRLVVSTARALGRPLEDPMPAVRQLRRLGQPLFGRITPDGWPDARGAWLGPDAMATRVGLAVQWGRGADASAVESVFGGMLGATTRSALDGAPRGDRAGLLLGSPEFQSH